MNYKDFKSRLKYYLSGDSDLRSNEDAIGLFYNMAVQEILSRTEPLCLITSDRERFTPYRYIDDIYFIRMPKIPENDQDIIDMDEGLQEALLNLTAAYLVRMNPDVQRRRFLENQAEKAMDSYIFESWEYTENMEYDFCIYSDSVRADILARLDKSGYLKYYLTVKDTDGWRYEWNDSAVGRLDYFMLKGARIKLSVSMETLWEQFCRFVDGYADEESSALTELENIFTERMSACRLSSADILDRRMLLSEKQPLSPGLQALWSDYSKWCDGETAENEIACSNLDFKYLERFLNQE